MHFRLPKPPAIYPYPPSAIFADQGKEISSMDVQPFFPPNTNTNTNTNREFNEGNLTVFENASIIGYGSDRQPIFANNSHNISNYMPAPAVTGLTSCNLMVSRKRPTHHLLSLPPPPAIQFTPSGSSFSFLGEHISLQIERQQLEIDQLVEMHAEQMKFYIQERKNRIVEVVEQEIMTKLREKDEEIAKIGQINFSLHEKVKTLSNENQLWKDLAHRNHMTANALKNNLDLMLDQIQLRNEEANQQALMEFNALKSSGSSNSINYEGRGLNDNGIDLPAAAAAAIRLCRRCGTEESSVLLLPCRHLCVCTACASFVLTCPICQCTKNGTVNINFSSF